ncbi:hypothetical protein NLJ89_g10959 [Agrocybe chaxingu]|uniref:Lon proteolytic domain-containing protein n=1 Tax=Agrocybe chaxingu TaxID=84603 RepID=A0A9W8MS37_9AGAR|nr:hypothetical protein NLJ89_g10959 [Agrocybe chaxingu]
MELVSRTSAAPEPGVRICNWNQRPKDTLIEKFYERAANLKMPDGVKKIPWSRHTPENYPLTHATTVLNEDHYGLDVVKSRILSSSRSGSCVRPCKARSSVSWPAARGGQNQYWKSIARALGRQFFRFGVGGLTDVAEIMGHRRTYVGALPGKIIQALKLALIDEVDKIDRGHNDPANVLEMLNPDQNNSFLDHYMDVPVDLSCILFVCTANNLDTTPAPLLDRMEVLKVFRYVSEEKAMIASRYLGLQAKEASGLGAADVELDRETVDVLIRESGSMPGKGNLQLTGITKAPEELLLTDRDVHVHIDPLCICVTVYRYESTPMTREISLVGRVLPVSGLKGKILAAHRAGTKTILAPAANRADIEENVPESVKEGRVRERKRGAA